MAVEYINAVYSLPDLNSSECAVLVYLANRSDGAGSSWPSRQTIADKVRLHPDTVKAVLQGLAGRGLIEKQVRHHDGRQTSNRLVLLFPPLRRETNSRGDTPPQGGCDAPPPPGVERTGGGGVTDPREEAPYDPSVESVARWAERIWSDAPIESRRKSTSKAQTLDALHAARKRGRDLAVVAESLRRYFDDPENRRDKCRGMKGVHRVIQNDVWESWSPEPGWAPPVVNAEAPPAGPDDIGTLEAPGPRRQRAWLDDWRDNPFRWDRGARGPAPDEPGCRCSPELLREYGVEARAAA